MFSIIPPVRSPRSGSIASIPEALAEIRAGRMIILMDDEDRENEGDLCMAAELATPEHINFMATHGRGLICLPLTEERLDALGLPMMVAENRSSLGTAFTASIDARRGTTRGISAADRATTIRTAVDERTTGADLVSPGHIFPLRARRGGVLVRAGQTEGGVDLARLAGLKPASVICEIMSADGTMARLPELEGFAREHQLKIATVADLINYRLHHDSLVHRVATARIVSRYGGEFTTHVYTSDVDPGEHLVLVKGDISPDVPTLVRTHTEYLPGDVFGYQERNTSELLHRAMMLIADEGRGVILYLRRETQGQGLFVGKDGGERERPSTTPWHRLQQFRDFGIGAQILRDVGVGKIRWLTNRARRLVGLAGYGLEIVESVPISVDAEADADQPATAPKKVVPLRS
jgi:3,4-dihydroxy 2-butanone 4-phosphate synthase/GTP cyclohydrolase II